MVYLKPFITFLSVQIGKLKIPSTKDMRHIDRKLKSCWDPSSQDEYLLFSLQIGYLFYFFCMAASPFLEGESYVAVFLQKQEAWEEIKAQIKKNSKWNARSTSRSVCAILPMMIRYLILCCYFICLFVCSLCLYFIEENFKGQPEKVTRDRRGCAQNILYHVWYSLLVIGISMFYSCSFENL